MGFSRHLLHLLLVADSLLLHCSCQDPLYFAYKHSLMVLLGILPVLLLIVAAGGMRVKLHQLLLRRPDSLD